MSLKDRISFLTSPAEVDAFLTEVGRIDVEALRFEHQLDALRCRAVVLDQEYTHAVDPLKSFLLEPGEGLSAFTINRTLLDMTQT